jgi:hypothetical protein
VNVDAFAEAFPVRQVLHTIVENSSSSVRKLCAGVPSLKVCACTLCSAFAERYAGATESRSNLAA